MKKNLYTWFFTLFFLLSLLAGSPAEAGSGYLYRPDRTEIAQAGGMQGTGIPTLPESGDDSSPTPSMTERLSPPPSPTVDPSAPVASPPPPSPAVTPSRPLNQVTASPPLEIPPVPGGVKVMVNGRLYLYITRGGPSLTVERRAAVISHELTNLVRDPMTQFELLEAQYNERENYCDLLYRKRFIMRISEADVKVKGYTPYTLAQRLIQVLKLDHEDFMKEKSAEFARQGRIFGLQGLLVLLLITLAIIILTRWLKKRFHLDADTALHGVRFKNVELLSREKSTRVFFIVYHTLVFIFYVIVLSFFGDRLLGFFPGTGSIRAALFEYPVAQLKAAGIRIVHYVPNLIFIIACVLFTRMALYVNDRIFDAIEQGTLKTAASYFEFREVFRKLTRFAIYFFALVLILPNIPGYDLPIFKGLSVVVAVVVSLGSSTVVSNQMAGISLIISRAYKVGDRVKIGDHLGDVVEMALPYTRLRTIKKEDVIISNSVVTQKEIINYSAPAEEAGSTILSTSLSIGYDVPGDIVTGLCLKAVDVTDGFLKDPPPVVFQKSLDDSYITYVVFAHHRSPHEMVTLNSELNAAIREVFDTAGVEIMSPTFLAHRNGNGTTINERYRQAPGGPEPPQGEEENNAGAVPGGSPHP